MQYLCRTNGVENLFEIASAAVSTEEIGNDIYPPAKRKLSEKNIPFGYHSARQITRADYDYYDYIICADRSNIRWLQRIINKDTYDKVSLMMSWAGIDRDVSDPWYTGDFEAAYQDIRLACENILQRFCING